MHPSSPWLNRTVLTIIWFHVERFETQLTLMSAQKTARNVPLRIGFVPGAQERTQKQGFRDTQKAGPRRGRSAPIFTRRRSIQSCSQRSASGTRADQLSHQRLDLPPRTYTRLLALVPADIYVYVSHNICLKRRHRCAHLCLVFSKPCAHGNRRSNN
jgi:hypothetical protein